MDLVKIIGTAFIATSLMACGGGSEGASTTGAPTSGSGTGQTVSKVTLSGLVTFDQVPHKPSGFGLDYNNIVKAPARGIVVVLMDENNSTLEQTVTDASGQYSFQVDTGRDVKVQARAQLNQPGRWDVKVTDNTLDNALYAMEGSLNSSGTKANQTRNLHAVSGWGGSDYTANRVSAPFAILDPVYDAIQMVVDVDSNADFPAMEYRWSPDNKPIAGNKELGQIGTSGFHKDVNAVYLLGDANRDTDEYDPHVILHEWGHYFEHNLARMDSMGGLHSLHEQLDPRLAFSEGFGNGLASIITGDPVYKDSSGRGQGSGFEIDFETLTSSRAGWFNEGSIAAILYDIYDQDADGSDRMSAGFGPIYHAMTDARMRDAEIFGTIFTFSDALLAQNSVNASDYRLLLEGQKIASSDAHGAGELNSGTIASSLPVYKTISLNSEPVTVCSVDDAGRFNKLGNREFVYFEIPATDQFQINVELTSGEGSHDPDFNIWKDGRVVEKLASSRINSEQYTGELSTGAYVAEVYDFYNINGNSDRAGDACFSFSISGS